MKTTIENLKQGEVLLTQVKKIEGGKVQLEFAEFIDNPTQPTNVLAALNADDERFKQSVRKPRRAWLTASPAMVKQYFGVDCSKLGDEPVELNILNPTLEGQELHIQSIDSFVGTPYQMENQKTTAKQFVNTNDGQTYYFTKESKLIFNSPKVVAGKAKHVVIKSDARMTWEQVEASQVIAVNKAEALND